MTLSEFKRYVESLPEGNQDIEIQFNYKDQDGFVCTSWRKNFKIGLDSDDKIVITNS